MYSFVFNILDYELHLYVSEAAEKPRNNPEPGRCLAPGPRPAVLCRKNRTHSSMRACLSKHNVYPDFASVMGIDWTERKTS